MVETQAAGYVAARGRIFEQPGIVGCYVFSRENSIRDKHASNDAVSVIERRIDARVGSRFELARLGDVLADARHVRDDVLDGS